MLEQSTAEFGEFSELYFHHFRAKSNSGIRLELLQEYIFIPLDIFRKNLHNKGINNDLDAWLTFLSVDEIDMVECLMEAYPDFIPMYRDVYEMCRNVERVMELYSKELLELDRNTVQLMIDEMQDMIDTQKEQLDKKDQEIAELKRKLELQK